MTAASVSLNRSTTCTSQAEKETSGISLYHIETPQRMRGAGTSPRPLGSTASSALDHAEHIHAHADQRYSEEQGQKRVTGHQRPNMGHQGADSSNTAHHGIHTSCYLSLKSLLLSFKMHCCQAFRLVAGGGFEPPSSDSVPDMLPLHHPAICAGRATHTAGRGNTSLPGDQRARQRDLCYN